MIMDYLTKISNYVLNEIIKIGPFINSFFNFWFKPEWIFVFISGVVGAYVGIKLNKRFGENKRIHSKSLIKQSINTTLGSVLFSFIPF